MSSVACSTIAENRDRYTTVSAIEVCTIEGAKQKGILSRDEYYIDDYSDLKTYNGDASGTKKDICSQSADGADAFLFCSVEHGNIAYKRKGNKCVTYSCPTGWEGVSRCTKPLEDAIVSKRSHCDERWYDWYTVPNYHLGNKFQPDEKIPGTCYNPCPSDHVPQYKNDPIDGSTFGLASKEALGRCVPKNQYFGGKYVVGSDFCPLAWIYRVGATPNKLADIMTIELNKVKEKAGGDAYMNSEYAALSNPETRDVLAKRLYASTSAVVENVEAPTTANMQQACRLLQTPERLTEAYNICQGVIDNEDGFLNACKENGDNEDVAETKLKVLKQACNATFCDPNNDAAKVINREPLCIKSSSVEEGVLKNEEKPKYMEFDGTKTVKRAIPTALYIIMTACFIGLLFVLYRYLKPVIRKVVLFIMRIILRVPKEVARIQDNADNQVGEIETQIAQLRAKISKMKQMQK